MKTILSIVSSLALLLSLPALASSAAEKAVEADTREAKEESRDTVKAEKGVPSDRDVPPCGGTGGAV